MSLTKNIKQKKSKQEKAIERWQKPEYKARIVKKIVAGVKKYWDNKKLNNI